MTINRWGSFEGSKAARPQVAPGTACAPCTARGHFCAAYEIVDGRAVCLCCLDGVPCMRTPSGTSRPITGPPKPAAKVLPTSPQPALAPGAEPSPVMPARRQFLQSAAQKTTCSTCRQPRHTGPCICTHGCGRPRHSGLCRSATVDDAVAAKVSVPKTVATKGHCVVCKQPEHTGPCMCVRGCGKTRHRGSCSGMVRNALPKAEEATRGIERVAENSIQFEEKVPVKSAEVAQGQPALSRKYAEEGYRVIPLADMPGRKYKGVYDEIFAEFMKLPKNFLLTKTYENREIANTYMLAIVRIGRKSGLKMRQKQDGNTIYVWQV